jgi:lipopolysaccharide export system protein LptA
MTFYLVAQDGRILNVVEGDMLTIDRAAIVLRANPLTGERVTSYATLDQLRDYEQAQ